MKTFFARLFNTAWHTRVVRHTQNNSTFGAVIEFVLPGMGDLLTSYSNVIALHKS